MNGEILKIRHYISIARPDNWSKNLSMLGGAWLAYILTDNLYAVEWFGLVEAMVVLCMASSANYTINEYIDAHFDKFHPVKRNRASVRHSLNVNIVIDQYFLLAASSLAIA